MLIQNNDLQMFLCFCPIAHLVVVHQRFNYSTALIDSQLQLSEQPVDGAHMLWNSAQTFYVNLFV